MSRLDQFKELAKQARDERVPTPDVSAAVRQRLAAHREPLPKLPLIFAAACAGAAMVMGYFGLQAWTALTDPWFGPILSASAWWLL